MFCDMWSITEDKRGAKLLLSLVQAYCSGMTASGYDRGQQHDMGRKRQLMIVNVD